MAQIFTFLFVLGQITFALTTVAPEETCRRSTPDLNACLKRRANILVKELAGGIEKSKLPPLDPLNVEFMSAEGDLDNIKVEMTMKNITLYGLSNAKFSSVKFDPNSLTGELSCFVPFITMTCDYVASGHLFAISLESDAHFIGNFSDYDVSLLFRFKTVKRKGVEFYTVDKMTVKLHVDKGKMQITSVNPANQPQVALIQNFFNENDKLVFNTTNPILEQYGSNFYKYVFERYLRRLPADELLPK